MAGAAAGANVGGTGHLSWKVTMQFLKSSLENGAA
jgi:hypothetical protein